jgi:SPP1 gp7 family putative phage head morphogenesis protein
MPEPISLSFAMGLAPKDAVAYFESKGYRVTFDWKEMDQAAHAKGFTIAKMAGLDMLRDVQTHLVQCLKEGKTEAWFQKQMEPYLKARGWWGKSPMIDPRTGEERPVQLGSPARLKLIYRQNMQTAFMAGRYKQMLDNADARPWWQYVAVLDRRTRPSHKILSGRTFRYDDPFWGSHYPPNGWNCRCRVRALSDSRLEQENAVPESGVGNMVTEKVAVPDSVTGQTVRRMVTGYRVPETGYTVFTDIGFSANPGEAWLGDTLTELTRKLDTAPPLLARQTVHGMVAGPTLPEWLKRPVGHFPLAVLPAKDAELIGARSQVTRLSPQTAGKQAAKHPELTAADYALAQGAVDHGERIQDSAQSLIYVYEDDDRGGLVVVVKATEEGDELFVQSIRRLSRDEADKDRVVRHLKRKSARPE